MPDEYLLDDKAWEAIEPLLPTVYAGARRHDDRRIISGICSCPAQRLPLEGLPGGVWTLHDHLQPLQPLERTRALAADLRHAGRDGSRRHKTIDSTSIKVQRAAAGGEGGARKQAIGRSRGGRTTKIHGVADSQGRLFRFTLTAGNIADITAAHELAAKLPSNGCLIGDMGYDAKKFRVDLAFRGTATVIPTNPTHKHQW